MKQVLISLLKKLRIYHPLQSRYRAAIGSITLISNRIRYAGVKGDGFTCNYCTRKYQRFVPEYPPAAVAGAITRNQVIAGYGENVFCPNCMSKNRERLILAVLNEQLDIRRKHILHFSPEKNLFRYLNRVAEVTTVDTIPGLYKNIDPHIRFADATRLQFQDSTFDFVIANHILEHIPDDRKALSEIYRVLKPGGMAILQVPFSVSNTSTIEEPEISDPSRQESLFGQRDHVRIYGREDYISRVAGVGFQNQTLEPVSLEKYRFYAIQENEPVFLFLK